MEKKIKVSIIVPVYNVEKYLKRCLDSLISQTLQDIEIICINDGSTDGSVDILKEYENRDSRIKVISKINTGYGNSMNVGMHYAKGEYIGIVESDDFADNNMFEVLYKVAEMKTAEVVKSNFYIYQNGKDSINENLAGVPYMELINPANIPKVFTVAPSIWSALYSREFIEKNNINFNETPGASYQDVSFAFEVMCKAKRVICIEDAFLHYRMDNMNSSVKAPDKVFCIIDEFHRVGDIIQKNQIYQLEDVMVSYKYRNYLSNFFRMDSIYQYAFLYQMHLEIKMDYEKGLLANIIEKDRELANILEDIRTNYEVFFIKNSDEYIRKYVLGKDVKNALLASYGVHKLCEEARQIIIYGAGNYAEKLYEHIKKYNIIAFAVSDENHKKQDMLHDIPIAEINELADVGKDTLVIVAISIRKQEDVVGKLKKLQFKNIVTIDKWIERLADME